MVEVKYRLTWQLALSIILVMVVAVLPVIVYFIDYKEIFLYIMSAIIGWTVLALVALMGAFLLGLAVGHRLVSKSNFSPFEVEMMKMKEEIGHLKELLHRHNIHHKEDKEGRGGMGGKEVKAATPASAGRRPPAERSSTGDPLVEEEPELQRPEDPGPGMMPIGKVKCRSCKATIPIYTRDRPLEVKCTNCGRTGVLR